MTIPLIVNIMNVEHLLRYLIKYMRFHQELEHCSSLSEARLIHGHLTLHRTARESARV